MITQTKTANAYRPGLIVAHSDPAYAALLGRSFTSLGWEVQLAATGAEVRRLAWSLGPAVVILDTDLDGESGWLTCDKLTREHPQLRVILVGEADEAGDGTFADFVGAAGLVRQTEGVQAVIAEVCSVTLPAAG
jgi:DNA-binding response OmpR family regulator